MAFFKSSSLMDHPVDGRNRAPVDMVNTLLFTGFYISQVVQDFFHQQYALELQTLLVTKESEGDL